MPEQVDDELKQAILDFRMKDGKTAREIAKETGLSVGKVGEIIRGIPAGKEEKTFPSESKKLFVPMLISKEYLAKLYAMAMDEGFDDVNAWMRDKLLPWYALKRDLEWKLRSSVEPKTFMLAFEASMLDSLELKELKTKMRSMSGEPATATVNKPQEAKTT